MSTAAHGIWFTEKAGVAGTAFHMALGIWFDGELDEAALAKACAAVIARHEALSTVFTADGFAPAAEKVALTHAAYSPERVSQELARPFDLVRGPLARFTLLRENPRRCLLLFTAHHLVFDGMSKDILYNEDLPVVEALRSAPAGRHAQPEELANVALFLVSDEASFVHGAVYVADGGWTIR